MDKASEIREVAEWLNDQSTTTTASSVTKEDLENLKHNIVLALLRVADIFES